MTTTTKTAYPLPDAKEGVPPFEALGPTAWQLALYNAAIAAYKLEAGEGVIFVSMQEEDEPVDAIIPPRWEEFTRHKRFAVPAIVGQIDRFLRAEAAIRDLVLDVEELYQRPDASKAESYGEQCLLPCFDAVYSLACLVLERGYVSAMELWEIAMPEAFAHRTTIAVHEAGHAVVHHLTGETPVYVSIVPGADCLGNCVIDPDPNTKKPTVTDHVAGLLAGPFAERMVSGGALPSGSPHGDVSDIARIFEDHDLTDLERGRVLMSSMKSAKAMLRQHWDIVEELAQELLHRHWMAGEELDEFLCARATPGTQKLDRIQQSLKKGR